MADVSPLLQESHSRLVSSTDAPAQDTSAKPTLEELTKAFVYTLAVFMSLSADKFVATHLNREFHHEMRKLKASKWQGRVSMGLYFAASLSIFISYVCVGISVPCNGSRFLVVHDNTFGGPGEYVVTDDVAHNSSVYEAYMANLHHGASHHSLLSLPMNSTFNVSRTFSLSMKDPITGNHLLNDVFGHSPDGDVELQSGYGTRYAEKVTTDSAQVSSETLIPNNAVCSVQIWEIWISLFLISFSPCFLLVMNGVMRQAGHSSVRKVLTSLVRAQTKTLHGTKLQGIGFVTVEGIYALVVMSVGLTFMVMTCQLVLYGAAGQFTLGRLQMTQATVLTAIGALVGHLLVKMGGYILGSSTELHERILAHLALVFPGEATQSVLCRMYMSDGQSSQWCSFRELEVLWSISSLRHAVRSNQFPFEISDESINLSDKLLLFEELPVFVSNLYIPDSCTTIRIGAANKVKVVMPLEDGV